jgi:hypothetical protein
MLLRVEPARRNIRVPCEYQSPLGYGVSRAAGLANEWRRHACQSGAEHYPPRQRRIGHLRSFGILFRHPFDDDVWG